MYANSFLPEFEVFYIDEDGSCRKDVVEGDNRMVARDRFLSKHDKEDAEVLTVIPIDNERLGDD
jgi:hypothetical protein